MDQVVPFHQLVQHQRNVGRIVLKVGVHRHDHVAAGHVQPGVHCRGLPEVAAKADHLHVTIDCGKSFQLLERAIGRAVVHQQDLMLVRQRPQHRR